MAAVSLTLNSLHKSEMEYYGIFWHTLGRIQHIDIMSIIDICYTGFCLGTQTLSTTIIGLKYLKHCIQYLASNPHKPIFCCSDSYDEYNFIILTWIGTQVEDSKTQNCL